MIVLIDREKRRALDLGLVGESINQQNDGRRAPIRQVSPNCWMGPKHAMFRSPTGVGFIGLPVLDVQNIEEWEVKSKDHATAAATIKQWLIAGDGEGILADTMNGKYYDSEWPRFDAPPADWEITSVSG